MKMMSSSMAVVVVAAMLLGCSMVPVEGRALLNLGKLIDHLLDCPPPPTDVEAPAAEPYSAPYYTGPPADVISPAPVAYDTPAYPSPPGPPAPAYASGPIPEPSPPTGLIPEPTPEYQTPPAGGYWLIDYDYRRSMEMGRGSKMGRGPLLQSKRNSRAASS